MLSNHTSTANQKLNSILMVSGNELFCIGCSWSISCIRIKILLLRKGSEQRNNANAESYEKLRQVAALSSPPSTNTSPGGSADSLDTILSKVHTARDKHIFRCEFTILYVFEFKIF